jgi:hypothetical protein
MGVILALVRLTHRGIYRRIKSVRRGVEWYRVGGTWNSYVIVEGAIVVYL